MKFNSPRREILIIVSCSIVLALVYNAFSSRGLPLLRVDPKKEAVSDSLLFGPASPSVSKDTSGRPPVVAPLHDQAMRNPDSAAKAVESSRKQQEEATFQIITLDQLKRLLGQRRGVLIDARTADDYAKAHIPGARNYFGEEPEKYFEEIVQIPRDSLIIIYCNNPQCHLGRSLAEFMKSFDFARIVLYDDGWDGWIKSAMPVDTAVAKPWGDQ